MATFKQLVNIWYGHVTSGVSCLVYLPEEVLYSDEEGEMIWKK